MPVVCLGKLEMGNENEESAIFADISSFHPIDRSVNIKSSGMGRFIAKLERQMEMNTVKFRDQIEAINRGVSRRSSEEEKNFISKIHSLEHRLADLQEENNRLSDELSICMEENKRLEKRLVLASTENSRLKQTKISAVNSRRPTSSTLSIPSGSTTKPLTVDIDKYRRALLYIDELQHRLRPN